MIGPLNSAEAARLAALPRIGRARGHRLYALDGTRWLDCWADGGRALLGHQTKGLAVRLKNEIDRGLLAPYPSRWDGRLEKALLRLFPGYSQALVFGSLDLAMRALDLNQPPQDPLDAPGPDSGERCRTAVWGRPLLPNHPQAEYLFPLLPLPGFSNVQPVLLSGSSKILPKPEAVSPLAVVGMLRVCASIQAVTNQWDASNALFSAILADTWERRGPYMLFRGNEKDYEDIFDILISRKILIAPSHLRASVLPPELSKREALMFNSRGVLLMSAVEAIPIFVRLLMAFLAAFFGIGLWSKTRDAAWMLVVLGTIFLFIDSLFSTLVMLGLASYNRPTVYGIPVLEPVLAALPSLFLAAGFLVFLLRNRRY